mgnify:CR=1 FL=1
MGIGKYYIISPKFISADGGFKRVVWMSKNLKDTMAEELKAAAEREGIPDLVDRIADVDAGELRILAFVVTAHPGSPEQARMLERAADATLSPLTDRQSDV